ncbi:heme-binding protein [Pelagibacterium sp. 26DY04]|uniref:GlcG/HbpS family heme-binding protein n=1 Tax=Pelagibacterium sp. 26DY04 TaxID=2967130 RepID=UPI002814BA68|nr:heme-binding protein [Pelagibacterium sp. 26DY04]WMT87745.1 heme-binding protein [Pelagibacterium sp. 26DY04]
MAIETLTLARAQAIAEAVISAARGKDFQLALAVVDTGGWSHLQIRMDGAFPAAIDAALAKARTAALFRRPSSDFSRRVKEGMPLAHLPHVVPLGGGVLLERDGVLFGALGVSGAREDTETELAEEIAVGFAQGLIGR